MPPRIGPEPEPPSLSAMEKFRHALPFGIGIANKPRDYRERLRAMWENRGRWLYARRILKRGVCDGCSLGPYGLHDDVADGRHLCATRLRLLKLNTMRAFDPAALADVEPLARKKNDELMALGRIPAPLVRCKGEKGFTRVSWDEALDLLAELMRAIDPMRMAWFASGRGATNEGCYAFQKVARVLGSPHVDSSARLCHAAAIYGLEDVFGLGAANCSLKDLLGTDLLVLWGANLANSHPVTTKYMHLAKEIGTRIAVVNPYREPGLVKYWVPSILDSAVFGTRLMDDYYPVRIGGDVALMNGVMKAMHGRNGFDVDWLDKHAAGVFELGRKLESFKWKELEEAAGLPRAEIERFASIYMEARSAVFAFSTGLTQQRSGVENARSIGTLAAVRGMVGRKRCGVLPMAGQSGVQGASDLGVAPDRFPGGLPVDARNAKAIAEAWGAAVPALPGLAAPQMIEAAHEGKVEFLYAMGGNLLAAMPDRAHAAQAIERIGIRVHQDIVLNSSMLLPPGDLVVLLPAMTRYEIPGGCTSTSAERRIRFSPEIPGPRVAEAKPDWEIPVLLARQIDPKYREILPWQGTAEMRREIERVVPLYKGIAALDHEGQSVQWGGERLFEGGKFDRMPEGKLRLWPQDLPKAENPPGRFQVTSRRGRQFNSMVHGERDPLTGCRRDAVLMNADDAKGLGISEGDAVRLVSQVGEFAGRIVIADVRRGTLQIHWPEANVLVARRFDRTSNEPDYNVFVDVSPAP